MQPHVLAGFGNGRLPGALVIASRCGPGRRPSADPFSCRAARSEGRERFKTTSPIPARRYQPQCARDALGDRRDNGTAAAAAVRLRSGTWEPGPSNVPAFPDLRRTRRWQRRNGGLARSAGTPSSARLNPSSCRRERLIRRAETAATLSRSWRQWPVDTGFVRNCNRYATSASWLSSQVSDVQRDDGLFHRRQARRAREILWQGLGSGQFRP